jgi:hypothetical protein
LWPKLRPDIVRKTGTRQRRSSGLEKVELARAYAQTHSEARYITAGSVSTVRRQEGKAPNPTRSWSKKCDPPLQRNIFCGAGRWHIPTISPGPPLQMDRNCQAKLSGGVETYLLSACAATSYLLTLGMSFCSRCRRSTSSQTRRAVSGSALFWIMASSLATLGVFTGDTSLCLPLGFRDRCASRGAPRFPA